MTELIVAEAAAEKEDYFVCTKCDKGYEGNKCELCADGYFGDPMAENGTCQVVFQFLEKDRWQFRNAIAMGTSIRWPLETATRQREFA